MGMNMHVNAVKPADDDYKKKAAAYHACEAAKIPIPSELRDFFDGERPDPTGTTICLDHNHECCVPYNSDSRQGFEIDVKKLPTGTRFVRFYCSW